MQITVTSTPTRLDNPTFNAAELIALRDSSADIYLGGPDVTMNTNPKTDGWPYKTDDQPMLFRPTVDGLWAVTATTATIEVLQK